MFLSIFYNRNCRMFLRNYRLLFLRCLDFFRYPYFDFFLYLLCFLATTKCHTRRNWMSVGFISAAKCITNYKCGNSVGRSMDYKPTRCTWCKCSFHNRLIHWSDYYSKARKSTGNFNRTRTRNIYSYLHSLWIFDTMV